MDDGPLTSLARGWVQGRQAWRMLDPVEQDLRRASHGFALIVFTVSGVLFVYGWHGVAASAAALIHDPAANWPGPALVAVLIGCGTVRFVVGARRMAGKRDGLRASTAFVRMALGLAVTVWLGRFYPWPGATGKAAVIVPAVFLIGLWCAVIGGVRFAVLITGGGNALRDITRLLRRQNAPLRPVRKRRFWFW